MPKTSRLSSRWSGSRKPATGLTCSAASTWSTRASVPSAPTGVDASTRRNSQRAGRRRRGRSASAAGRAASVARVGTTACRKLRRRQVERAAEGVEQARTRAGVSAPATQHRAARPPVPGSRALPLRVGRGAARRSPAGRATACARRRARRSRRRGGAPRHRACGRRFRSPRRRGRAFLASSASSLISQSSMASCSVFAAPVVSVERPRSVTVEPSIRAARRARGPRRPAARRRASAGRRPSTSTSHSSHSGTHGWAQVVTPTRSGSAPL